MGWNAVKINQSISQLFQHGTDATQVQFLRRVLLIWTQSLPAPRPFHTKLKEPSLSNYLPIAEGRIVGSITFLERERLHDVMTNVLDDIIVSEFELQSRNCIHFGASLYHQVPMCSSL